MPSEQQQPSAAEEASGGAEGATGSVLAEKAQSTKGEVAHSLGNVDAAVPQEQESAVEEEQIAAAGQAGLDAAAPAPPDEVKPAGQQAVTGAAEPESASSPALSHKEAMPSKHQQLSTAEKASGGAEGATGSVLAEKAQSTKVESAIPPGTVDAAVAQEQASGTEEGPGADPLDGLETVGTKRGDFGIYNEKATPPRVEAAKTGEHPVSDDKASNDKNDDDVYSITGDEGEGPFPYGHTSQVEEREENGEGISTAHSGDKSANKDNQKAPPHIEAQTEESLKLAEQDNEEDDYSLSSGEEEDGQGGDGEEEILQAKTPSKKLAQNGEEEDDYSLSAGEEEEKQEDDVDQKNSKSPLAAFAVSDAADNATGGVVPETAAVQKDSTVGDIHNSDGNQTVSDDEYALSSEEEDEV
uniref:Uncharacterized protein n=1 Tax=Heterosigma akashiwo TaxID=2829 RepID=A0A7S3V027_HETAK